MSSKSDRNLKLVNYSESGTQTEVLWNYVVHPVFLWLGLRSVSQNQVQSKWEKASNREYLVDNPSGGPWFGCLNKYPHQSPLESTPTFTPLDFNSVKAQPFPAEAQMLSQPNFFSYIFHFDTNRKCTESVPATGYIQFVLMSVHFQFQKLCANVIHFCQTATSKLDDCQHIHSLLHIPSCLFTVLIVLQSSGPVRRGLMEVYEEMKSVKSLVPWVILCIGKLNQIQQISFNCCVPCKNRLQVTSDILISVRIKSL